MLDVSTLAQSLPVAMHELSAVLIIAAVGGLVAFLVEVTRR